MSTSGANPGARGIYGTSAFSPRYFHSHTIAYDVVSSEMRALTLSASDISITSEYSLKVPMDRVERNRLAGRRPEHIWHVFGAPSNYIFISHNSAARLLPIVERAERLGPTAKRHAVAEGLFEIDLPLFIAIDADLSSVEEIFHRLKDRLLGHTQSASASQSPRNEPSSYVQGSIRL